MRELWAGVIMACRRWQAMLGISGMIAAACVVFALALEDVVSQVAVLKGGQHLREQHAVTFTPYYPQGEPTQVGNDTIQYVIDQINNRKGYTAIIHNMALDDPDFAGGYPTLILFGDVIPDLFPELPLCESVPCAMKGSKIVDEKINAVNIEGENIPVVGTLPAGATFFDPLAAGLPLDNRIVIRAPTKLLPLLNSIEKEEAITRTVLLDPEAKVVDTFITMNANSELYLIPHDIAVDQPQRFRELMGRSAIYIVGMLSFLLLVFIAFVSSARLTIRQEDRAFKIRAMYGATPFHLSIRIGGFLAAVVLIPPVALLSLLIVYLHIAGAPSPNVPLWVILGILLTFFLLWLWAIRSTKKIGG
ncbi:hypothetical protein P5F75_17195 [Caldifermentibacillus hisashii]|uniref:hypothetical protein n=1 Tax=Caldifermentibacillus hisashii TaxID=996558 RepID=UPI002E1D9B5D|nr:hypothetical protein [Caldifermentibacillus hisashii]